jgi:putative MATE family efflux protein
MTTSTRFVPSYKNIWWLTFPLIFAGISETIVGLTDAIFLGHYGVTELAALGLADAIYAFALFLIAGFVDGIQITIGRRAGEEEHLKIGKVLNQGLCLLAGISALMILLILWIVPLITVEVFQSIQIHDAVELYLDIAIYGLVFHAFNLAMSAFYVGISRTDVFIGATFILAVTNILLDYFLIFGNMGFKEMGMQGAAVASLAAEIAVSVFFLIDVLKQGYVQRYGLFLFERCNTLLIKTLARLSVPVSLTVLVESLRWVLFFVIIEQLGESSLAIATIIFSCYALLLIPVDAFSETICSMVSNLLGQKDDQELSQLIKRTIVLVYTMVIPLLGVTLFFPEYILAIFSPEEEMISGAVTTLMVIMAAVFIAVPADILASSVAGTGDTIVTFATEIIVSLSILAYAYYAAFIAEFSLEYIWFTEIIGWTLYLILSWLWLKSGIWKRLNI